MQRGRRSLNFSEWDRPQEEAREAAESVQKGTMPPWYYAVLQRPADLSTSDRGALIGGLQATLGRKDAEGETVRGEHGSMKD